MDQLSLFDDPAERPPTPPVITTAHGGTGIWVGPYELREDQLDTARITRTEIARLMKQRMQPRVLIHAPCGFGKTVVSCGIIEAAIKKGSRVAFIAHGRILIYQKSRALARCGIRHGILMAQVDLDELDEEFARKITGKAGGVQVVVASKDTYWRRGYSDGAADDLDRLNVDLVIVDEAHASMSQDWLRLLSDCRCPLVGLTATPAYGKGQGMGGFWKSLVTATTNSALLEQGVIVPARVFAPVAVDMSGVPVNSDNDEYSQPKAAERFDTTVVIGDVVHSWLAHGGDRPSVYFAQSVEHSVHLADAFNKRGVPAVHIDQDTPQKARDDAARDLREGRVRVITNYAIYRVGVDLPFIGCIGLACSMKNLVNYVQTVSRGFRSCDHAVSWGDGIKRDCIVIDHGMNVYRHGWPTDDRPWTLDPDENITIRDVKRRAAKAEDGEIEFTCFSCGFMFNPVKEGSTTCPNCGKTKTKRGQKVRTAKGTIREITPKKIKERKAESDQKVWEQCLGACANMRKGPGTYKQALVIFRRRQGYWLPAPGTKTDDAGNDITPFPQAERYQHGMPVRLLFPRFVKGDPNRFAVTE